MTSIAQIRFLPVVVIFTTSQTYVARVSGQPLRCSNTSGFDNAANSLKGKYFAENAKLYRVGDARPKLSGRNLVEPLPCKTEEEQAFHKQLSDTGVTHIIVP